MLPLKILILSTLILKLQGHRYQSPDSVKIRTNTEVLE